MTSHDISGPRHARARIEETGVISSFCAPCFLVAFAHPHELRACSRAHAAVRLRSWSSTRSTRIQIGPVAVACTLRLGLFNGDLNARPGNPGSAELNSR